MEQTPPIFIPFPLYTHFAIFQTSPFSQIKTRLLLFIFILFTKERIFKEGTKLKRLFLCMERELVVVKERYGNYEAAYHLQNMQPTCIAVDPFQKNRIYCGTFGRGLWLSDDSGDSWRPIGDSYRYFDFPKEDGILHSSITSITISSNEQVNGYGVVYVGTEPSALFRSEKWWGNVD